MRKLEQEKTVQIVVSLVETMQMFYRFLKMSSSVFSVQQ